MADGLRFTGKNAVVQRPPDKEAVLAGDNWARDRNGKSSGTEVDATWFNRVKALIENTVTALGGSLADGDDQLKNAIALGLAARAPADHAHDERYYLKAEVDPRTARNVANGYAGLDSDAKIPVAQLPALTPGTLYVASSQSAMLALSAAAGDTCYRSDNGRAYLLTATPATTLGNWVELAGTANVPGGYVASIDGQQGTVITGLGAQSLGRVPAVNTGADASPRSYGITTPVAHSGLIDKLHWACATAQLVTLTVASGGPGGGAYGAGGSFTVVRQKTVFVPSGVSVIDNLDLQIDAGQYVFAYGTPKVTTGLGTGVLYWYATLPDLAILTWSYGGRVEFGVEIRNTVSGEIERLGRTVSDDMSIERVGLAKGDIGAATAWSNTIWAIPDTPSLIDGFVTDVDAWGSNAGNLHYAVFEKLGSGNYRRVTNTVIEPVGSGLASVKADMPILAGQFVGYRHTGGVHYTSNFGVRMPYFNSEPVNTELGSAPASTLVTARMAFGATIQGAVRGGVVDLNVRVAKLEGSAAKYVGKKVAALGSSITVQNFITGPIASKLGCTLQNLGVSGASLGAAGVGGSGGLGIYNQIANIDTASVAVILETGTNDFGAGRVPLGAWGDTTTATYYGALYAAVEAIYARAPDAIILLTVPTGSTSAFAANNFLTVRSDGARLHQFQDAIRITAQRMGLLLADWPITTPVNYYSGTDFMGDGLHPNALGGLAMANVVIDILLRAELRPV
jgi:hypothetical protein